MKLNYKSSLNYLNVIASAIRNPKVLFRYISEGTKRDPIPWLRRPNGSIATNDVDEAQISANHFEIVFTRESSLPEIVSQSRNDVAKIEYVQITCSDVRKILKSLKKEKFPCPDGIPPIPLNKLAKEIRYPLTKIVQASLESGRLPKYWLTANVSPIYKGCQRVGP